MAAVESYGTVASHALASASADTSGTYVSGLANDGLPGIFLEISRMLATVAPSYFGEKHIYRNHSTPRYVWVPGTSSFGGPVLIGPDGSLNRAGNQTRKRLNEDQCDAQIHIWASGSQSDEQLNDIQAFQRVIALRDILLTALHSVCQRTSSPVSMDWKPFEDSDLGICGILTVKLSLTVIETFPDDVGAQLALCQQVEFDQTGSANDGVLQAGET